MRSVYPVIFTQTYDEKETVLIEVPDLNIMTEGYGMADAIKMARDAIGLMGITLEDEKKPIPNPTNVNNIDITKATFKNDGESCISLVDIDFKEYRRAVDNKSVRRNVTLPSWLNKEAEQAQINVSKVLKEALMEVLGVSRT